MVLENRPRLPKIFQKCYVENNCFIPHFNRYSALYKLVSNQTLRLSLFCVKQYASLNV